MTAAQQAKDLIQQGQAAARVGHTGQARDLLRQAVQLDPGAVDAWLALSGVEESAEAKVSCLDKVLSLDPDHTEARLSLDLLQLDLDDTPAQPASDPEPRYTLEEAMAAASKKLDQAVALPPDDDASPEGGVLYCANHPKVETMLRCNRCSKPICTRCAVQTPVGYRCKQCVGQQRAVYYSGGVGDYVIGGIIAFVLGGLASFIMGSLGAWFFALILGPAVGVGISEAVRLAVRRRRSQHLWLATGAGMVAGALPALFLGLLGLNLWSLLTLALFLVLAAGAAVARLR